LPNTVGASNPNVRPPSDLPHCSRLKGRWL
jgi:hypothetical protein